MTITEAKRLGWTQDADGNWHDAEGNPQEVDDDRPGPTTPEEFDARLKAELDSRPVLEQYMDEEYRLHTTQEDPDGRRVETIYDTAPSAVSPAATPTSPAAGAKSDQGPNTPASPAPPNKATGSASVLYDPTDPYQSVMHALTDMGIPWTSPLAQKLFMRNAPALGSAFTVQNALNPHVQPGEDTGGKFRDYLTNVIASGNPVSAAGSALGRLPELVQQIRQMQGLAGVGGDPGNPLSSNMGLQALAGRLTDTDAIATFYSSLLGPGLGGLNAPQHGGAISGAGQAGRSPVYNMAMLQEQLYNRTGDTSRDPFKIILGY